MNPIRFAIILVGVLALVSCGSSSSTGPSTAISALYIAGGSATEVDAFDSPDTADGTVSPDRVISGANTLIFGTWDGAYDSNTDSLYVVDLNTVSILIFDGVSATNGNVAPSRVVSGGSTGITNNPQSAAIDKKRNLLYVAGPMGVVVFSNATTVDGNVAPLHTIAGANTNFSGSSNIRLALDETHDRLFVSDPNNATPSIFVFDNASQKDGNVAPNRTIAGTNTTFVFPWGISLDTKRNLLYVADEGTSSSNSSIEIFSKAGSANGNIAPSRTIAGTTSTINRPTDVYIDPVADTLYATDAGTNLVLSWDNASTIDGDIAPNRSIDGGFNFPGGLIGAQ